MKRQKQRPGRQPKVIEGKALRAIAAGGEAEDAAAKVAQDVLDSMPSIVVIWN